MIMKLPTTRLLLVVVGVSIIAGSAAAAPSGSGTVDDPYVIDSVEDLQWMENDLKSHYELGSDIDASDTSTMNSGQGFKPVGDDANEFRGSIDGRNHTISDLHIDRTDESYIGLFGLSNGSTIKDINLQNPTIKSTTTYDLSTTQRGIVVARSLNTTIEDVEIDNGTLRSRESAAGVVGSADRSTLSELDIDVNISITDSYESTAAGIVYVRDGSTNTVDNVSVSGSISGSAKTASLVVYFPSSGIDLQIRDSRSTMTLNLSEGSGSGLIHNDASYSAQRVSIKNSFFAGDFVGGTGNPAVGDHATTVDSVYYNGNLVNGSTQYSGVTQRATSQMTGSGSLDEMSLGSSWSESDGYPVLSYDGSTDDGATGDDPLGGGGGDGSESGLAIGLVVAAAAAGALILR